MTTDHASDDAGRHPDQEIADLDDQITQLDQWLRSHRFPTGMYRAATNGYDLHSADEAVTFAVWDYLGTKDREQGAVQGDWAHLGWATWVMTTASTKYRGHYRRLYFHKLSQIGGLTLRVITLRQYNMAVEEKQRESLERTKRQQIASPWKDTECSGCGAKKRAWADETVWICARCGTPLGHYPNKEQGDPSLAPHSFVESLVQQST